MSPGELDAHNAEQAALAAGNNGGHHGGILDGFREALHLGPSVAVAQQTNGSYSVDFAALPAGRIDINNLPDASIVCLDGLSANSRIIVKADGICYEFCRVSTVHHSGSFGFMIQHHRGIGEIQGHDVHSYRPNDEYVLVRVDECPDYEARFYGIDYKGFGDYSS